MHGVVGSVWHVPGGAGHPQGKIKQGVQRVLMRKTTKNLQHTGRKKPLASRDGLGGGAFVGLGWLQGRFSLPAPRLVPSSAQRAHWLGVPVVKGWFPWRAFSGPGCRGLLPRSALARGLSWRPPPLTHRPGGTAAGRAAPRSPPAPACRHRQRRAAVWRVTGRARRATQARIRQAQRQAAAAAEGAYVMVARSAEGPLNCSRVEDSSGSRGKTLRGAPCHVPQTEDRLACHNAAAG